jgi:antitoxin ParD1/3/4
MASSRTSINISLPGPLKDWVEVQVEAGDFGTSSEYIRHLLRREREERADLEAMLVEGMNSPRIELNDAEWSKIRKEVHGLIDARAAARKPRRKSA